MNKAIKKKLSIILISSLAISSLITGCGKKSDDEDYSKMSKKELISEINRISGDYDDLVDENMSLQQQLNAVQKSGSETTEAGINASGTGSKTLYFNSYDSKMIFPETWKFPNSTEVSSEPIITLAKVVTIKTNGTWTIQMSNGSTLYMEDTSGISVTINVAKVTGTFPKMDTFQEEVMEPWFKGKGNVIYNDIFVNGNKLGMQAQMDISIDGSPAYMKAGMFVGNSYTVTYTCVYRGSSDSDKNSKINDLINGMTISGSEVTVNG